MHEQEKDNNDRWLLTYSDLITLLMVFFVVMYAISEADKVKFEQLKYSMQRALKGDGAEDPGLQMLQREGSGVLDVQARQAAVSRLDHGAADAAPKPPAPTAAPVDEELLEQLRQAVVPLAVAQGVTSYVSVQATEDGVAISLSGNLLFDSGKAELRPEGVVFLHAVAEVLRAWPNRVRVEGHTDGVAINTSLYPTNWELSSARAVVTTRYLVEQEKLAPGRIGVAAYGEFRPVADNATREGRARNRRIDILVLNARPTEEDTR